MNRLSDESGRNLILEENEMTSRLVHMLFDTWDDLDRVIDGLDAEQATGGQPGSSTFAWTVGHLAAYLDFWINVRFAGREPHTLIGEERFRFGGTGMAEDWGAIVAGAGEVRAAAREFLSGLEEDDLDRSIPYQGIFAGLRGKDVALRYYVMRTTAHHYFHIGEIASKRDQMGHEAGDYPGPMSRSL